MKAFRCSDKFSTLSSEK